MYSEDSSKINILGRQLKNVRSWGTVPNGTYLEDSSKLYILGGLFQTIGTGRTCPNVSSWEDSSKLYILGGQFQTVHTGRTVSNCTYWEDSFKLYVLGGQFPTVCTWRTVPNSTYSKDRSKQYVQWGHSSRLALWVAPKGGGGYSTHSLPRSSWRIGYVHFWNTLLNHLRQAWCLQPWCLSLMDFLTTKLYALGVFSTRDTHSYFPHVWWQTTHSLVDSYTLTCG